MSNILGTVTSGWCGKYIARRIPFTDEDETFCLCELPDRLQDVPNGWLAYLDRDGRVQVMEDDFLEVPEAV